jgi:homoserine kinase
VTLKQIEVYAPASIANLGPGFDVFGLALENIGDVLRLISTDDRGVSISLRGIDVDSIPVEARANSAGAVLHYAKENLGVGQGFHVEIDKGVPQGKGLGSSGASAAAAAYALNLLLDLNLSLKESVRLAAAGEAAVAGSAHADNVSASLLGGFTLVGSDYDVVRLDPPDIEIVIVVPDVIYENKTMQARALLPKFVELKDAVLNISHASKMAVAAAIGDSVLFGRSICDSIIEPRRAKMIPQFWEVKQEALDAGAHGCSIAGGGPSVFAVGGNVAEVGKAMVQAFSDAGIKSEVLFTKPSLEGARVF